MSESFPLFQSSLSSTPFSGTMAETSTETPAGALPQTPVANEMPGQSGDRARAEKLKSSAALDTAIQTNTELLKHLNDMKWSKHPESDRWVRRQRLGLNGNKDTEPPEMMYRRFQAMSEVSGKLQSLLAEKRLSEQLSPYEEAFQAAQGAADVHTQGVMDRRRRVIETNATLKEMGLPEIPPDKALEFSQNPTANISGGRGPEDLLKGIKAQQDVAHGTTAKGVQDLLASGQITPLQAQTMMHAVEQDIVAAREKKTAADKPEYTTGQLFNMGQSAYNDILAATPMTGTKKVAGRNPFTGVPDSKYDSEVPAHSPEDAQASRVKVAIMLPDLLKKFPNYVKEGAGAAPAVEKEAPVSSKQADVKTPLQIAREKVAAAKAKQQAK